jgi:hypothetical protein
LGVCLRQGRALDKGGGYPLNRRGCKLFVKEYKIA